MSDGAAKSAEIYKLYFIQNIVVVVVVVDSLIPDSGIQIVMYGTDLGLSATFFYPDILTISLSNFYAWKFENHTIIVQVLRVIGKGSFGQVVKAFDHKTKAEVALKMVRNEKRFHKQAQEEIKILQHLRSEDPDNNHNVVHMIEHFLFRNHICITFELLSMNLYELIKRNKFQVRWQWWWWWWWWWWICDGVARVEVM